MIERPIEDGIPAGLTGPRRIVDVTTTHLEMERDRAPTVAAPPGAIVLTARPPSVPYYRWLYDAVGAPWHWYDRKRLSDEQLAAIVQDPQVDVHVAYQHGSPVGYVELDRREATVCEVAYFGLVPHAIGRGLGTWLLTWAVHTAWEDPGLRRLWVHTCTLDGPAAIPTYQRAGFRVFQVTTHQQYIVDRAAPRSP